MRSSIGRVTEVSNHGNSYPVAPLDGSQVKLRNRRFIKPVEPESYELSGAHEAGELVHRLKPTRNGTRNCCAQTTSPPSV